MAAEDQPRDEPRDLAPASAPLDVGVYTCPHCQQAVAIDPDERTLKGPFIPCPYCGREFAIGSDGEPDEQEAAERTRAEQTEKAELDAMRIRQVSAGRRAAIRARSWLLIGVVGCLVGAGQCIWKARELHRREQHWGAAAIVLIVVAIALFPAAGFFARRWLAIGRELAQPLLDEPTTPPDFSTLGDGTQHWKKLEDVQ
jgi:hypothetical protein